MEFKGVRLGPALKIVGYSSYLRAKSRILSMNKTPSHQQQQRQQDNRNTPLQGNISSPSPLPNTPLQIIKPVAPVCKPAAILPTTTLSDVETVHIRDQPHHIEDAIPLHKNLDAASGNEATSRTESKDAEPSAAEHKGKERQSDNNVTAPHMVEC